MKKVVVIGLGHGGLVAAQKLAKAGFDVAILEKKAKEEIGYPWEDDIRFDIFSRINIPAPPEELYCQKTQRCFIAPDLSALPLPKGKPMEDISISRKGLLAHLASLAEQAGAVIQYQTPVEKLVILDNRVVGVKTADNIIPADLVVDASGFLSPFRAQVPEQFGVQAEPAPDDRMEVYRAIHKKTPGTETPHPERHYYIRHRGGAGISWCNVNSHDEVDLLVGRIGTLPEEEWKASLADMKEINPTYSEEVVVPGRIVTIALRSTIGRMVADGFALVGDSAFMTMPFMGSGLEASMLAGSLLAQTVIQKADSKFTAADLWDYQVAYYQEQGATYAFVDILKRWVLNLEPEKLNWLFGCGAVTPEDMLMVSTDQNKKSTLTPVSVLRKIGILLHRPDIIGGAIKTALRGVLELLVAKSIPKHYHPLEIKLWQKLYEGLVPHTEN